MDRYTLFVRGIYNDWISGAWDRLGNSDIRNAFDPSLDIAGVVCVAYVTGNDRGAPENKLSRQVFLPLTQEYQGCVKRASLGLCERDGNVTA